MINLRRVISSSIAAFVMLLVAGSSSQSLSAANNFGADLAGWWRFDECSGALAADASGLGNDGSLQGQVAFTTDAVLGCALDFTGDDGGVVVAHDPSLEPASGTIEAWIKIDSLHDADIVRKTTNLWVRRDIAGGFSVYGLRINANGSAIAFVGNDDPDAPGTWTFAISPAGSITTGVWHHLAMRWDGNAVAIFVDGVLQATTPYVPVPEIGLSYHGESFFGLGIMTAGGGHFIGQLDDVRFYGRARPDVEIFTDYTTRGHKPAKPGR